MFTTHFKKPLVINPCFVPSPISLPEKSLGRFSVTHITLRGEQSVIGMRQAFQRGVRPCVVNLMKPLVVHELREDQGVWMSDRPEELFQIKEAIAAIKPKGTVLVGGLGLGLLPKFLVKCPGVKKVVVVEIRKEIIKLCASKEYEVIQGNIFDFVKKNRTLFDCWMLDTWAGNGECAWWENVLPLRRDIRNRWGAKPKIWCWAEDIMQGQVMSRLMSPERDWLYTTLPLPMTKATARRFLTDVGMPTWERRYGGLLKSQALD